MYESHFFLILDAGGDGNVCDVWGIKPGSNILIQRQASLRTCRWPLGTGRLDSDTGTGRGTALRPALHLRASVPPSLV